MIEQRAVVVAANGDAVQVTTTARAGCARCEAGQGCGGGVLGRLIRRSGQPQVEARNAADESFAPGDAVIIGLQDDALVGASALVYLLPLATMLAAALVADSVIGGPDWVAAGFGALGLVTGFAWVAARARQPAFARRYQPVVLRRANAHTAASCPSQIAS